jgi:hypothetical protein
VRAFGEIMNRELADGAIQRCRSVRKPDCRRASPTPLPGSSASGVRRCDLSPQETNALCQAALGHECGSGFRACFGPSVGSFEAGPGDRSPGPARLLDRSSQRGPPFEGTAPFEGKRALEVRSSGGQHQCRRHGGRNHRRYRRRRCRRFR